MTDLTALAIELAVCPRCEARPRQACVTLSGVRATRPHSPRTAAVELGWRAGYDDGLRDSLGTVERLAASNRSAGVDGAARVLRNRLDLAR